MIRHCCSECFRDQGLRKNIIPRLRSFRGKCNFCSTEDVDLVNPRDLADDFETLAGIYEENPNGNPLADWMQQDWGIFQIGDSTIAKELLGDIFGSNALANKNFSPSPTYKSEELTRWDSLRNELMYKNRYFLDVELDKDRLKDLLTYLLVSLPATDPPERWYRARITNGKALFPKDEMGAPPNHLASHGRANPTGIPYLYLGSLADTAVAEVRPHTGEVACVAEFHLKQPITAVDLRNPRKPVSPFLLSDASEIGQMRADLLFLEQLGSELTRPVLPRSAAIDYLPSQYLCEFIKKSNFDGVLYSSSVSNGINLALFDPAKAVASEVSLYNVNRVSVEVSPRLD